jgi:type I restriction enzyme R subunit
MSRRPTFLARLQTMPPLIEAGLWPAQIKAIRNLSQPRSRPTSRAP